MRSDETTTSKFFYPKGNPNSRRFALWYFGSLITLWTILGHTYLGFEQSHLQPIVGVIAACATQYFLEWVNARSLGRTPRYSGGWLNLVNFLIPAWIPGTAVGMLIYPNDNLWPIAFAAALSIASKALVRVNVGTAGDTQHIFNPSNFGISLTLLFFPWIGLAPPYHFTENVVGVWDWIIPGLVLLTGIYLHAIYTKRLPLILAWIGGFLAQAFIRSYVFDIPWQVPLIPMTSVAFIVFTLYMIPDPATTPLNPWRQALFGFAVAAVYGVILISHIVFGLFFALLLVCALRGVGLQILSLVNSKKTVALETA